MKKVIVNIFFLLAVSVVFLSACNNYSATEKQEKAINAVAGMQTENPDMLMEVADSLVVVFYKDPYGEDSLRYTRYYTQVSIVDQKKVYTVKDQIIHGHFQKNEKRNYCRSEGKVWCFAKGKFFQTLYFSASCPKCCYLYLIKDGFFYYTTPDSRFLDLLKEVQPLSKEP